MALKPTDPVYPIITRMQAALEGQANTDIAEANSYIIANAVAILARDRAHADELLSAYAEYQRRILDDVWAGVRAELAKRKLS